MKQKQHNSLTPRRRHRGRLSFVLLLFVALLVFSAPAQPARALFGVGDVSVTIGDIPRLIFQAVSTASQHVQEALKAATDIAFKNSLQALNARIAQEVVTQIATAEPGQKPLFLTNPKTFFRDVTNSAAGDFIDQFSRGLTGQTGPGASTSTARSRYLISRILRTAVGSPIEQCRKNCNVEFGTTLVEPQGGSADRNQQNDHEYNIQFVYNQIVGAEGGIGTQAIATDTPTKPIVCQGVRPGDPSVGTAYVPWQIDTTTCSAANPPSFCTMAASDCLRLQREAINVERSSSQGEVNQCLRECQTGVAGAATQAINTATATDIFSATNNFDASVSPKAVANALSSDSSDIGQLMGAFAQLSVSVQDKVTGEQTTLNSGTIPRTSKVSGVVLVPKEANQQSLLSSLTGGQAAQNIYTGTSAADIIKGLAAFINSPTGKLLSTFFKSKCGLNPSACTGPTNPGSTLGQLLFSNNSTSGLAGAKLQFAQYGQSQYITGDPGRDEIDVANQLTSSGLIDAQFRSAIEDRLTVQEALDKGLLSKQKTFGFNRDGTQPTQGYPYRALQYLRKYRVIPVGWELASMYSKQYDPRDLSLGFLTSQYAMCDTPVKSCSNVSTRSCDISTDCACTAGEVLDGTCTASAGTCQQTPGQTPHSVCSDTLNACATDNDCNSGATCGASPYCGLVDPNWVLKAPQTYCRRQGAGEEIITKEFVCDQDNINKKTGLPGPDDQNSSDPTAGVPNCVYNSSTNNSSPNQFPDIGRWVISRSTDTCADTQSCIAENEDGTCVAYGYCVQERQTYKFDGTQCDAQYASCTTYTDDTGQQASYLASTLDFRNCSSDVAGCQWYCKNFDAGTNQWSCAAPTSDTDTANTIRLTSSAQSCNQNQAGCSQYITTAGGTNLLPNGNFETYDGATLDSGQVANYPSWSKDNGTIGLSPITATDTEISSNNSAAVELRSGQVDNNGNSTSSLSATIDSGYALYERTFVGSVRARADTPCTARLSLTTDASAGGPGIATVSQGIAINEGWNSYAVTDLIGPETAVTSSNNSVRFTISMVGCVGGMDIDSAQLEENNQTQYKDYGLVNNIYLNGNRQSCSTEDVGCEAYTPVAGGATVNGQVRSSNRCSADQVGCATYTLEPLAGPIPRPGGTANIIPQKGQQCSANYVGCEEFTNLDEVAKGGEGLEYYQSVKQCVKPDPNDANQATYYTWVGDAKKGFILQAHELLKTNLADGAPCTHVDVVNSAGATPTCSDDAASVTAATCRQADLATNPDCGEFYDSSLQVFYRLRSKTISVSNDCHPYKNSTDQTDNDPNNNNNIYFLAKNENVSCPAQYAGCRAYTGNTANTTRTVFTDNFETGTTANWVGGTPVSASVNLGGHSMYIPLPAAGVEKTAAYTTSAALGNQLVQGKSYIVSFLAAAADETSDGKTIDASFGTVSGTQFNGNLVIGSSTIHWNKAITPSGPQWQQYTFGPVVLNDPTARLGITVTGGSAFVDNVTLTEITDHLYLVSGSVPQCDAANVGCAAYRDRSGTTNYLTSFNRICSEQVVGCEAMIDTHNSTTPFATTVKNVTTPADSITTFVNNKSTYCSASAKGCQALGKPIYTVDNQLSGFQTVYLKNDPDRYAQDLCLNNELSCRAYTVSGGTTAFFKDPTNQICEFRADNTEAGGQWYITGTNYRCPTVTPPLQGRPVGPSCSTVCASNLQGGVEQSLRVGKGCVSDSDCPLANGGTTTCQGTAVDVGKIYNASDGSYSYGQCSSNADCGPSGNQCVYLAGTCPDGQNGCNEYRDPSDPVGCRSTCPLILVGGSPLYVDASCAKTVCANSSDPNINGQNCQNNAQCGDGQCVGGDSQPTSGFPGCRSYFYLRQTVEQNSGDCNGQVDPSVGCRAFNDTSKSTLNFRGN